MKSFTSPLRRNVGTSMDKNDFKDDPDYADFVTPTYDCYEDDEVSSSKMPDIDDIKEEHDIDTYDKYVGAHVRVPIGDKIRSGKVVRFKRELDGTVHIVNAILPKMETNRNTARSVVFGTSKYGGLVLDHLTAVQGFGQLQYMIGSLRTQDTTSNLYKMLL
jgi:hypothetical protein